MNTLFVTRANYDAMLKDSPNYMATEWVKLKRKWSIAGCQVSGNAAQITKLIAGCRIILNHCQVQLVSER